MRKEREGKRQRAESEICGLVTFNLVALHIAILHFTYDGDIQDITTGITKADRSTSYWHRDNAHSENQNHKQGDRKMTFNRNSLTVTSRCANRVI